MVESLYGRRRTAQLKHDKFHFPLGQPHLRKASGEPPNLRTIAETDDVDALPNCSQDTTFLCAQGAELSNDNRGKPRAISLPLPTVYRDGSYLRINVSETFNADRSARRRRFSEPAVGWSTPLRNEFSSDRFDEEPAYEYSTLPTTPKISITEEKGCSPSNFDWEKRRHSDPLLYNSVNNIQDDSLTCVPSLVVNNHQKESYIPCYDNALTQSLDETPTPDSVSVESVAKTQSEPREPNNNHHSRRRKSSVVPIPFGVNKTASRTRQKTSSRRRFSFPLTKNEQELTRNLQEIERDRLFRKNSNVTNFPDNLSKEITGPCKLIDMKCNDFAAIPTEEFLEENKASCEKIITQWMKFFG